MSSSTAAAPVGFAAVAAADPDRVAVIDTDGTSMTFGELARRVNQLSRALRESGLRPGECVVAMLPNRRAYYELRLATFQVGLYFTPVSHHFTAAEIAYILRDSGAGAVVLDASLIDVVAPALAEVDLDPRRRISVGGTPGWVDYEALLAGYSTAPLEDPIAGEYMGYTSGTTGRPKGVRKGLPGRAPAVSAFTLGFMGRLGIRPGREVHLAAGPLYHAGPGTFSFMALQFGHTVVVAERPRPEKILALIERHRVSVTFTVPTVVHRLLRLPEEVRARYDVSSMRAMVLSGASCPPEVKRAAIAWFGPVVCEFYGTTEGSAAALNSEEWLSKPGSVGHPLPGMRLRILDADGVELPTGEIGNVYFMPPVPFEYHNDPDKTASAMRDGFFSAGDLGYLDADGWLYIVDRRVDLILSGGVNVYPAEIEVALITHPAVADVAVIGVPDPDWGQRVVAVVQPEPGTRAGDALAEELTEHCRAVLAGYKVPKAFEFRGELPRNGAGKLRRSEVRETFLADE
ncbi:AMP-binding protein [Streptosporangium sp. NPDC049046]|uniref:AMP-binding protein n=1 Tax=Streptosporangium sp. NPDC049046 TaxID=3155031 RepID=UPI0034407496